MLNNIREDYAKMADDQNLQIQYRENRISEFYERVNSNLLEGVAYIDSILENDITIDNWEKSYLNTIVGETLFDNDSIKSALMRFEVAELLTFSSPRSKANKAGCYVKMGDFNRAMDLLTRASEINSDYKWYIGNLYEVMNNRKNAIKEYHELYEKHRTVYSYCLDRINEIEKNNSKLLSELVYRDRGKRTYLLLKPSEPNSSNLNIGRLDIMKKESIKEQ